MNRLKQAIEIVRYEWFKPSQKKYSSKACLKKLKKQLPAEDPRDLIELVRQAEKSVISLVE